MNEKQKLIKGSVQFSDINVSVNYSIFLGSSGVNEHHITLFPTEYESISKQLTRLADAYKKTLEKLNLPPQTCVFRRFFCSDLANQYETIKSHELVDRLQNNCSVSIITQPPYPHAKIAMWAYHISDKKSLEFSPDHGLIRGKLVHYWDTNVVCTDKETVYQQTECILSKYKKILENRRMNMTDNLIRTWFFIRDIDTNYREFVEARKKVFKENGLIPETHFVTSTGVEGTSSDIKAKVLMDAYSVGGIKQSQIKFIRAPEYICPTYAYGVTFERGVAVNYRDRRHVIISGTASINNRGEIVYQGNIEEQLVQTLSNIEILLSQAHCNFENVCVFIVYVRDITDAIFIYDEMNKRFENTPLVVVAANVCRPGWLIEIECQAISEMSDEDFPDF